MAVGHFLCCRHRPRTPLSSHDDVARRLASISHACGTFERYGHVRGRTPSPCTNESRAVALVCLVCTGAVPAASLCGLRLGLPGWFVSQCVPHAMFRVSRWLVLCRRDHSTPGLSLWHVLPDEFIVPCGLLCQLVLPSRFSSFSRFCIIRFPRDAPVRLS